MNIRILSIAAILAASLPALGAYPIVSKAHEVALADLRLPGSASGTLSFKPCDTCDYRTVRVTAATQYRANDRNLSLEDFRNALGQVRNRNEVAVTVLHHLESDTIRALRVRF